MVDKTIDKKPKGKFGTYVKRIILIFLLFIIIVPITIITLAQFEFFRSYALKTILGYVNDELIAEIHAKDLRISLTKGLTIYSASLYTDGDTLAYVDEINLKFDISSLLQSKVSVNYLKLTNPTIKLLRNSKDSLWNYDKIAKPSDTPSDTTPSNWHISVDKLIMENAFFIMYDSTLVEDTGKKIDFNHMAYESLNMEARAEAILDKNTFRLKMKSMSAKELFSGLTFENLAFDAKVSPDELTIDNLDFKSAEYKIDGDLKMTNYNVFGIEEPILDSAHFDIDIEVKQIDQRFIEYFSELPITITGKQDINIESTGNLNNLKIANLYYDNGESNINASGTLYGLIDSDNFAYELNLDNSMIQRANLIQMLPDMALSELPQFGIVQFDELFVKGSADSVFANMNLKSNLGNVKGSAGLNFARALIYSANVQFTHLNLAKILNNPQYLSDLNGSAKVTGRGTEISTIWATGDMQLGQSKFLGNDIKDLALKFNADGNSQIVIENLQANLHRSSISSDDFSEFDIFDDSFMHVTATGSVNLSNIDNPSYKLDAKFESLSFAKLMDNPTLPTHLTGTATIEGIGIHPDSLAGKYNIQLNEILFTDRALMPFGIDLEINKYEDRNELVLNSDFFDATFSGQYNLGELIDVLAYQGTYLGDFINAKVMSLDPDLREVQDTTMIFELEKIASFPTINGRFNAVVKDISPMNAFIQDMNLFSKMEINMQVMSSDSSLSVFIDTLKIDYLDINLPEININLRDIEMDGRLVSNLKDSLPVFEYFDLKVRQNGISKMSDITIDRFNVDLRFDGEDINFKVLTAINGNMGVVSNGKIAIADERLRFSIDSLQFFYENTFSWHSKEPIVIETYENTIDIKKFVIGRGEAEHIEIVGAKKGDDLDNIMITVFNFPVQDIMMFADADMKQQFSTLKFNIDSMRISITNDVFSPIIKTELYSDSISINNQYIGTLKGDFLYDKDNITGTAQLFHELGDEPIELMNLQINYLPIYIGLDSLTGEQQRQKKSDIVLTTQSFPLEFLSPFVPGLSDIRGRADINLKLGGILHEKPVYSGKIKTKAIRFRVDAINMEYNAMTEIYIDNSRISIVDLKLQNVNYDARFGRLGKAEVLGFIDLDDKFQPTMIDVSITADRLLVLNDNTSLSMPDLYGDFIISTDANPIHFSGTLQKPNLSGDINVIYAELSMPLLEKKQKVRTQLEYEVIDSVHRIRTITRPDTMTVEEVVESDFQKIGSVSEQSIADLINYDLRIKILGQFTVLMDMNLLGELYAEVGTRDRNTQLIYQKNRDSDEARLYGDVIVKENSTLKFFKQFRTSGSIQFPTGSIENPSLNLEASHSGTMIEDGDNRRFEVRMKITGTKDLPIIKFTYFVDGVEATGSEEQINENALFLLVMGRTKTGTDAASNDLLTEGMTSSFTNFANKALTEMLMTTGVISSAELDFAGNSASFEQANLRISGQILGGISWTIGGTIADLSANNEISIDIPASEFLSNPFWSNFILQVTKATTQNTTIITQDAKNWEVKIKFGNSW
ncbi:MAG: translocation/assembly module TamB domain-containing protein [Candidatus Kapabacteria bacterium]|nr:translocation/assembly module TamB domain-containing protein [Candidatus Kapabacteria bacterium]